MTLPLSSLKVVELDPDPISSFCGTILSDFGANVIIINQSKVTKTEIPIDKNFLNRGKRSIVLDLSTGLNLKIFKDILRNVDVLLDSFLPGTLETLGLSPNELLKINSRLIICRISGYGQKGPYSQKAGQDINFLAYSGLVSTFGPKESEPEFHANILSFGGGSVMGAIGVLMAVLERNMTGRGQIIDNSITDSLNYLNSFVLNLKRYNFWNQGRGKNLLDSGAPFYKVYQCKNGGYLSVGAIEQKFYQDFIEGLNLDATTKEKCLDNQLNQDMWDELHQLFKQRILEKTVEEWKIIYDKLDACTCPVLSLDDLTKNSYHLDRKNIFLDYSDNKINETLQYQIAPAPKLSNHPHSKSGVLRKIPKIAGNTYEILKEFNIDSQLIQEFYKDLHNRSKL